MRTAANRIGTTKVSKNVLVSSAAGNEFPVYIGFCGSRSFVGR